MIDKAALDEYRDDAQAKLEGLPARMEKEKEDAKREGRRAFPIVPLVEVAPAVMKEYLESVGTGKVPDAIAETYGTVLRVCNEQNHNFAMRADQLLELLKLKAGGKKEADNKVE